MAGFLNLRIKKWPGAVITRSFEILPTIIVAFMFDTSEDKLDVLMSGSMCFSQCKFRFLLFLFYLLYPERMCTEYWNEHLHDLLMLFLGFHRIFLQRIASRHGRKLQLESKIAVSNYMVGDKSGHGNFMTVQAAVDVVPVYNFESYWVLIAYNKPNIKFQRAGRESSIIMWDLASADSAAFSSFAPNFTAKGIGFRNAAPPALPRANGKQAVAALLAGDMAAFYGCGFSGAQDTVFDYQNAAPPALPRVNGKQAVAALLAGDMAAFYGCGFSGVQDTLFDYQGRHYFKDCYIESSIDFIFGHGQSTYKDRRYLSGSITAPNRATPAEISGFVFIGCKIIGTGQRAWGAYSRVIFAYTYMANIIVPQGWDDWGLVDRHGSVDYGEY